MRDIKVILLRCFPQIFIFLPKMIPTSPHADTGHECSDGFLSHFTSSYLVQLKPSGNSSGLLWYLILTILTIPYLLRIFNMHIQDFIPQITIACNPTMIIFSTQRGSSSTSYSSGQICFRLKILSILVHTHFLFFPRLKYDTPPTHSGKC